MTASLSGHGTRGIGPTDVGEHRTRPDAPDGPADQAGAAGLRRFALERCGAAARHRPAAAAGDPARRGGVCLDAAVPAGATDPRGDSVVLAVGPGKQAVCAALLVGHGAGNRHRDPYVGSADAEPGTAGALCVNHSSWLDVVVLGGRVEACFIAKDEVRRWPLIGLVAKLGRTVFVSRARASTGRERDDMHARLVAGDNLILFPEGTTSDGSRVMDFRSSFLAAALAPVTADGRPPLLQPVSVVYDRLAGLPTGRSSRPLLPGTVTWISARISGGWRSIGGCGRACCCIRRSIQQISPIARNWPRRSGRRWPAAPRPCGRTGRSRWRRRPPRRPVYPGSFRLTGTPG